MAEIAGRPAALRFQSFAVDGVEDRLLQLQVLLFAPPDGRHADQGPVPHRRHLPGRATRSATRRLFLAAAESFRFV